MQPVCIAVPPQGPAPNPLTPQPAPPPPPTNQEPTPTPVGPSQTQAPPDTGAIPTPAVPAPAAPADAQTAAPPTAPTPPSPKPPSPTPSPAPVAPAPIDCSALFSEQEIAEFGGAKGPWNLDQITSTIVQTFQACDLALVTVDVVPKPTGDDPRAEALQRAETIRNALIQWIGPGKFSEDRFQTGLSSGNSNGAEVEIYLGSRGRVISTGNQGGPSPSPTAPPPNAGLQYSAQVGVGGVGHIFATKVAPNTALYEWVTQAQLAITNQLHPKNKSGAEQQVFVQAQYSLTTKQWTVAPGLQGSKVFQLSDTLQASFWAQLTGGLNVTAGTGQAGLSAGAQLQWQPADFFAVVGQVGGGPTAQTSGPGSFDLGFTISIQITK